MKRNERLLALVALMLGVLVLCTVPHMHRAAEASSLPELIELAPADSTFIAYADVAALRDSPLVERLTAMAEASNLDHDYTDFVRATGFDYRRDLDRAVLVARPGAASASRQTLAFVEGRFDREKIQHYALQSGKLARENAQPVYVMPSGTPGKDISIEFLAPNRVALSDGGDLSGALAAPSGTSLDPALRERISRISGAPIFATFKASALSASVAANAGNAASASSPFRSLQWVSVAVRPDGDQIILSAEGECGTPTQAQQVATALQFLRGVLGGALADPKARGQMPANTAATASHLLDTATITTEAARVRLLLTVTPEMLRALAPPPSAGR